MMGTHEQFTCHYRDPATQNEQILPVSCRTPPSEFPNLNVKIDTSENKIKCIRKITTVGIWTAHKTENLGYCAHMYGFAEPNPITSQGSTCSLNTSLASTSYIVCFWRDSPPWAMAS